MPEENLVKKNNRKRKKSFLKNARKYAKKGHFGRGSQMDEDTYQFFLRSLETFNLGFEDEESKSHFVENVFEHTENQEIECSSNQVGCRVIETFLPFANDSILRRFMEKFSEDLRPLVTDRFASFVLQELVQIACIKSIDPNINPDQQTYFKKFALKISKFLLNNLEDYMWDNTGNMVIRGCLRSLTQLPKETTQKRTFNKVHEQFEGPYLEEYIEIVKDYGERLILWPQFNEMCFSDLTSGLFQILLQALKQVDVKLLKKYLKKLLDDIFYSNEEQDSNKLPQAFMSSSALMLLEVAVQVCGKKMFNLYCDQLFSNRILTLATMKSTSFLVQKIIGKCSNKTQFDPLFDEMSDHLWEVIEKGHPTIALALCQACKRLSTKQGLFIQFLMKSFNCHEPEERQKDFPLSLSRLKPYKPNETTSTENLAKERLSLEGTLMLQTMLEFNKPIKIVNALLTMDTNDLKNLFSNSMGSHITDSFVKSGFVGEKSREKLVRKLMGTYQELAISRYGSRSFEAIWNVANFKAKISIMEELAHKEGSWSNTEFGRIIAAKLNLVLFKRNKENWKIDLNKSKHKPEEILAEVLK
ncbi:hypothetical protein ABEB36_006952 [Hypothenemus hampei]|uniref:Nucleolar protein 9 n=1 Tax=Hypothenemus hampei TaxID=57062 RepID=A0ABD1ESB2_HYPHA